MLFRAATPADIPEMVRIVNAAYRGRDPQAWTTEEHLVEGARTTAEELAEMMRKPGARFEVAHDAKGAVVGSVYLEHEAGGSCYLGMLSVDPARQANGVGAALVRRAESLAREWGCARMRILVLSPRQEVLAFYERRGFARTGRDEPFPVTGRSRAKVDGLRMVEMAKPLG